MTTQDAVTQHYSPGNLLERIRDGLQAVNLTAPTPKDLAPLDQFHTGGWNATLELAHAAEFKAGDWVLDVGGGMGGPARTIASEIGCKVEVVDLTEEFIHAGEMLTEHTQLTDKVTFKLGSALEMPYADATFDAVITQHAAMNIQDKAGLYREIYRVLKPGGRLALHDIMAGKEQPPSYPLPWARTPEISFLQTPELIRVLLRNIGFVEAHWDDKTEATLAWFDTLQTPAGGPPRLGLHVVLGADVGVVFPNLRRNLEEHRLRVVMAVLKRGE